MQPSRSTVMELATFEISLSLWEIRIEEMPRFLNSSSRFSSASLSLSFRLAVGSSRISSFTSLDSALAISTSCCLPTPISVIRVAGDSLKPDHAEQVAGPQRHGGPVDHAVFGLLVAEEDVFGDGEQRHQRQFLVDDDDAGLLAVRDAGEAPFLPLEPDLAGVGAVGIDAAQNLHQRRFAGPVLAHQRMDLAAFHTQIDVLKRVDARKRLGDPPHFKDRSHRAP